MSLNGLDDVTVKEAHEAAVAEPGGWFLLKYSSRDEVEILGKGNGGIVEIRNAISQYEEISPLFGFLRYRRRNVVLKYVPEECSRLVQARVTVHFTAVAERFSPHDTVFPISSAKELKDSTLSAACSLHTASGSTSSSTSSLRRRRLMEIAEDAEEDIRAKRQSTVHEERPSTAKTSDASTMLSPISSTSEQAISSHITPSMPYRSIISDRSTSPPPPREQSSLDARPKSSTVSVDERRKSTQSTRPDLYSHTSYSYNSKPKIKLGPRPSLDVGGRPHTSTTASQFRPISTLPTGIKITSKSPKKNGGSAPRELEPPNLTFSPPPMPEMMSSATPARPHTSGGRPTTSSGASIRPLPSPSALNHKASLMTPEKARLMKALELRKKREHQVTTNVTVETGDEPGIEEPEKPAPLAEISNNIIMSNDTTKVDDSGIAFDANSTIKTDGSDATRSDSYPPSPVEASDQTGSTKASSISESTDETVQEIGSSKEAQIIPPESHLEQDILPVNDDDQLTYLRPVVYDPTSGASVLTASPTAKSQDIGDSMISDVNSDATSTLPDHEKDLQTPEMPELQPEILTSHMEPAQMFPEHVADEAVKEHQIPRSKFSAHELVPTEKRKNQDLLPTISSPHREDVEVSTSENAPFVSDKERQSVLHPTSQRGGMLEPIQTNIAINDFGGPVSDANLSSDDDFMDELQSAVVQEAMPMSVSKSPISPVFPSPKKSNNRFSRVLSNPVRREAKGSKALDPAQLSQSESHRSVSASAAYLNRNDQQAGRPVAKKINLGSGISQRIKALEKLSSNGSTTGAPGTTTSVTPAFFSVQKGSVRQPSRSPSIAERASSLNRRSPSPSNSRESSPETLKVRDRSSSIQSRVDAFKKNPVAISPPQKPRPGSVSVTAKILRDHSQPFAPAPDSGRNHAEYTPLDLKQSPLIIDHQIRKTDAPKETIQQRRLSKERASLDTSKRERRSSITVIKDFISEGRSSFSERRRSMNIESTSIKPPSIRSPSRPPSTHATQRPMSISSRLSISSRDLAPPSPPDTAGSSSSNNDEKAEKRSNRASRMLRRMSSSLSSGRKAVTHAMSPTVREEFEPPQSLNSAVMTPGASARQAATAVSLGDVNVQFPDSLLWKRRSMSVDSNGYLTLMPALTSGGGGKEKGTSSTRRFHLSSFRSPEIPDVEMQELPNSVVLDFIEGGGLQVACEDRAGQMRVLKELRDMHLAWSSPI